MEENRGTRTLIEDAYQKIKQMIYRQKVIPGQRLVYNDLCKMFNMSRTPIILALSRLEQEGFLVSEAFRGFHVKPIDLEETWNLFGVREALEVYAVERAIERDDRTEMDALDEKLRNHGQYMPNRYDRKKFLLDAEFHIQVSALAGNKVLLKELRMILEHVYLRFRLDNCEITRMPIALQEHQELVSAMKKRNILKSVEIIRRHVRTARDTCIHCLSSEEEDVFL
jgi:DNA-binding GntR family transcriptional regulator